MGAANVSYEEIIRLEELITPKDDIYPYISWTGNYDVVKAQTFRRDDDVEDDRIKVLMELIKNGHDFIVNDEASVNVEADESDDDFQTPKGSKNVGSRLKRGKKRLPDGGMEKRKHKILASGPKQALFNEDMKAFVTQLFEHNFSGMEQRLQKQMAETFEEMRAELKDSRKEASVEVELGEPSPTKPSTSQAPLRRSTLGTTFDVNYSEADDMGRGIGTQGVEGLSQTSYVPGFDPSQTKKEEDWWTPMTSFQGSVDNPVKKEKIEINTAPPPLQWEKWCKGKGQGLQLSDSPLPQDAYPQASLYYIPEESWKGFTEWALNPIPLTIGRTCFNLSVATRVVSAGKWLGNEEMDAVMFIWRVNTTLTRWTPRRVAFMSAMFCLQVDAAYKKFLPNKKAYQLPDFLLGYGRGELPSHGQTDLVWGVDVDRLYFPLFINGNHWIGVCVNIIERKVEVFDCGRGKNRQYVEKFAAIIPRIKQLLISSYSIVDVPMKLRLNKTCCDCGAYALKHLECSLLGLDVSLVDDEIIMGYRQKIGVDLWEAAHDPIFTEVMTRYVPSPWERSEDKTHLFKWTDKSVVEKIEDFQDLFDVLLVDNSEFQKSVRDEMEDAIAHCKEKTSECIRELRSIKALFVCCLVMVFMYHTYA
ncbi:hypothetical protein Bca52824_056875 [Brassica carinata]|uniref:Ubiquitin-like protease family profile domain-containing protein n=1 Tax=Brassica carinata TaxID=52824 RepID=A0A8X7UC75_BRACI|nr:hypothetical protein Bca52824_056875 [Brassica carinata]